MSETSQAVPKSFDWRRPARWTVALVIVAFWLGMMALLVKDYVWHGYTLGQENFVSPETFVDNWRDYDEWMEIRYRGQPIGVVRTRIERMNEISFLGAARLRVRLPLGIMKVALDADAMALFDSRLTLEEAEIDCSLAGSPLRVEVSVRGDALYYILLNKGRVSDAGRVTLFMAPSLYESARTMLARTEELEVGDAFDVPVFDPLWNVGSGIAHIEVKDRETITLDTTRETTRTLRVETTFNGMRTYSWVSQDGETLRQIVTNDLVLEAIPPAEALERFPDLDEPSRLPEIDRERLRNEAEKRRPRSLNAGALKMFRNALSGRE